MSKVTLRRDELVAEARKYMIAHSGWQELGEMDGMMADFAMMIAARVAVRMMPPPGHVVVPREPTREMVLAAAGRKHEDDEETLFYGAIYRAMIAEATRKEDGE
jgi:hypothetical protein